MSISDQDEEEKVWVAPKLSVITGGKDGPPDKDWLFQIPLGTPFLTKRNKRTTVLDFWGVTFKREENGRRVVRLENPENPMEKVFVDSREFSKENELHMELVQPREEESE